MARHTACANGMRDRSEDGVRGLIVEHLNNSFGRFQRLVRIGNTSSRKKEAAVTGAGRCPFASPTSGIPIAGLRTCGGNPTRQVWFRVGTGRVAELLRTIGMGEAGVPVGEGRASFRDGV
jgi:hypothetical protein